MKKWLFLGFLVLVFALELQVTLNSPIAFGDEGFHVTNARYIGENVEYPLTTPLFGSEIQPERFNRPPLWNLIEGSFYMIFGFSEGIVKFLMPFIALITGLAVFHFGRKLYNDNVGIIAGIIAVTIPSYVTYVAAFYTAVPYVFFMSIAFFSLLTAMKTNQKKYWIIGTVFSGLAILTNIAGLFMIFFVILMGLVEIFRRFDKQNIFHNLKKYGLVAAIALLIIMPWVGRNIAHFYVPGCTNIQSIVTGACTGGASYSSEFTFETRTDDVGTEAGIVSLGLSNYLRFAYGFSSTNPLVHLIGLAFIPFTFLAGMLIVAKRRETSDIAIVVSLIVLFIVFLMFGGLFSGRSEDTARYFLTAAPIIGLVSGTYIGGIIKAGHKHQGLVLIAVMAIVVSLSLTSTIQKLEIMSIVKGFSPLFFEACDWTKSNTPENAQMFSLHTYPTRYNCERAAVWEIPDKGDILISNDIDLVKERLQLNGLDYIFVQKFSLSAGEFGQAYPLSFIQFLDANTETFEKVYENGPSVQQCVSQGGCDGSIIYKINY